MSKIVKYSTCLTRKYRSNFSSKMQNLNQSCPIIINNSRGNSDLEYKLPSTNNNQVLLHLMHKAQTALKSIFC